MEEREESTNTLVSSTLPLARIKTIMKSSPDVQNISQDCLFLIGKATELFVQHLCKETFEQSKDKMKVDYKDLSRIVHTDETLQFLEDIIPKKILVKDYLRMIEDGSDEEQ